MDSMSELLESTRIVKVWLDQHEYWQNRKGAKIVRSKVLKEWGMDIPELVAFSSYDIDDEKTQ